MPNVQFSKGRSAKLPVKSTLSLEIVPPTNELMATDDYGELMVVFAIVLDPIPTSHTNCEQNKMKPTNPNAHTYVHGTDVKTHGITWLCSHAQYLSAIVSLNSLVHVSLVTSLQCGVESVECGVWSVK